MASDSKHSCKDDELPFLPTYETVLMCQDKLRVTWFEVDFSQSRYNPQRKLMGSNACTMIVVLIAANCHKENLQILGPKQRVDQRLIRAIATAILKGNKLHSKLRQQSALPNLNMTIPEAIKYCGKTISGIKEWKSVIFMEQLSLSLHKNLLVHWEQWRKSIHGKKHHDLYVVLICGSKSVLFVMNDLVQTVTVIDSHRHTSTKGTGVAVTNYANSKCLCSWLAHIFNKYYQSTPSLYELSFLYFKSKEK